MATYTVRRGDNLTTIAKKFGTGANALIAANKAKVGANPNKIFSGTVLAVPTRAANANRSDDRVYRGGSSLSTTTRPKTTTTRPKTTTTRPKATTTGPKTTTTRPKTTTTRPKTTTTKPKTGRNMARARANGK